MGLKNDRQPATAREHEQVLSTVDEMGDRVVTINMGRKVGG